MGFWNHSGIMKFLSGTDFFIKMNFKKFLINI